MAVQSRISSLDPGYKPGDLSLYPETLDDKDQLYTASNNAETILKHGLSYSAKTIIVEDASAFPETGLLRIGSKPTGAAAPELVYYGSKRENVFSDLIRGFAGSRQSSWPGQTTYVSNGVMAEHHNAVKDAILNIESHVGTKDLPAEGTLNAKLKDLENRYLAPRPFFRAFPLKGPPGMSVRFQNFSEGDVIRYFWEFGDGTTSVQRSPSHVYQQEGIYTVKLNIITSSGAQGITVKGNYITVDDKERTPFFYANTLVAGPNYSVETAEAINGGGGDVTPQTFEFVDQTDAEVVQRFWVFDDGTNEAVTDPDKHTTTHVYDKPGVYRPSLLIVFASTSLKRVFLTKEIEVE